MQKYAKNCSFYLLKVQKIWHKIVTFSAPNVLDPLPTLNMHLIINNALLWDQIFLNWRDLEIIKKAGLVLRPTTVQAYPTYRETIFLTILISEHVLWIWLIVTRPILVNIGRPPCHKLLLLACQRTLAKPGRSNKAGYFKYYPKTFFSKL